MSSIFPPVLKGGVAPGPNTECAYTPANHVIGGDGDAFYYSPNCTTLLTDCAANAIVSEILAAVDGLGFAFNADRVNNLGEALAARLQALQTDINTRVSRSGDTMTGPLEVICPPDNDNDAACKKYVDDVLDNCCQEARDHIDNVVIGFQTQLDGKVSRSGDWMTGPLLLSGDPTLPGHAATRNYVDNERDSLRTALQAEIDDRVLRAGDTMTGDLLLAHDPVQDLEAATKQYVDMHAGGGAEIIIAPAVPPGIIPPARLWWNSATGQLFLHYDDGYSLQWVAITGEAGAGAGAGNFLPLSGGTLSGDLILHANPSQPMGAATRAYVDGQIALGGIPDAPADGGLYGRQNNTWQPITVTMDGGAY